MYMMITFITFLINFVEQLIHTFIKIFWVMFI